MKKEANMALNNVINSGLIYNIPLFQLLITSKNQQVLINNYAICTSPGVLPNSFLKTKEK